MKQLFFIPCFIFAFATMSCSQKVNVPAAVINAFNAKFPGATELKWEKENSKELEANFKLNSASTSANFGLDGSWKETETTINTADLPAAVMNAIKAKYPGGVITLAEKVEKPDKTYYETVIKINNKKKEIEILPDGKFM